MLLPSMLLSCSCVDELRSGAAGGAVPDPVGRQNIAGHKSVSVVLRQHSDKIEGTLCILEGAIVAGALWVLPRTRQSSALVQCLSPQIGHAAQGKCEGICADYRSEWEFSMISCPTVGFTGAHPLRVACSAAAPGEAVTSGRRLGAGPIPGLWLRGHFCL